MTPTARHWSEEPRRPDWSEEFLDAIPPVGVILLLCVGCWGMFILAVWGLWELMS
jgi:hypothetical protein